MKNKKNKYVIIVIIILLLVISLFFYLYQQKNDCKCEVEQTLTSTEIGKVVSSEQVEDAGIPKILLYLNGEKVHTINNEEFNNIKMYNYKIKTLINNKLDESIWLGVKLVDLITRYDENFTNIVVSSANGDILKKYNGIDNIYLFLKKNNENIIVNKENVTVLANITESSTEWIYSPSVIAEYEV